jgi:hypothetical protein
MWDAILATRQVMMGPRRGLVQPLQHGDLDADHQPEHAKPAPELAARARCAEAT